MDTLQNFFNEENNDNNSIDNKEVDKCISFCQKTHTVRGSKDRKKCLDKCIDSRLKGPWTNDNPHECGWGPFSDKCMPHLECIDNKCSKPKSKLINLNNNENNVKKKGYGEQCNKGEECIGYLSIRDDPFAKSVGCYNKTCKYFSDDKHERKLKQIEEERLMRLEKWNKKVNQYLIQYRKYLIKKEMFKCKSSNITSGGSKKNSIKKLNKTKKQRNKKNNKKKPYNLIGGIKFSFWKKNKDKNVNNKDVKNNKNKLKDCCSMFNKTNRDKINILVNEERYRVLEINDRSGYDANRPNDVEYWVMDELEERFNNLNKKIIKLNREILLKFPGDKSRYTNEPINYLDNCEKKERSKITTQKAQKHYEAIYKQRNEERDRIEQYNKNIFKQGVSPLAKRLKNVLNEKVDRGADINSDYEDFIIGIDGGYINKHKKTKRNKRKKRRRNKNTKCKKYMRNKKTKRKR